MQSDRKTKSIFIRCNAQLRRALEKRAARDGRSLSNYVRLVLDRHVTEELTTPRAKRKKSGEASSEFPFAVVSPPTRAADRV